MNESQGTLTHDIKNKNFTLADFVTFSNERSSLHQKTKVTMV